MSSSSRDCGTHICCHLYDTIAVRFRGATAVLFSSIAVYYVPEACMCTGTRIRNCIHQSCTVLAHGDLLDSQGGAEEMVPIDRLPRFIHVVHRCQAPSTIRKLPTLPLLGIVNSKFKEMSIRHNVVDLVLAFDTLFVAT